jgi:hypothetical protein
MLFLQHGHVTTKRKVTTMTFIPAMDLVGLNDIDLVDEAAKIDMTIKALTKKLDEAKIIIRSRNMNELFGNNFKAVISTPSARWTLDSEKVKTEMGEVWYTSHCKISTPAPSVSFKPYLTLAEVQIA